MKLTEIQIGARPEALFFRNGKKTTLFRYRKNKFAVRTFGAEKEFCGTFSEALSYMLCGEERKSELIFKGLPDGVPSTLSDPTLESVFTIGNDTYCLYRMASFGLYRLEKERPREAAMQGNLFDLAMMISDSYSFEELKAIKEEGAP